MPKTVTTEPNASQPDGSKRQRKKLAKQEAKAMLKIEQAKRDVKKAEKKFTRAQSNLDENQTHLHALEEKLQQIRTNGEPQAQASLTPLDASSEIQPEEVQTQEVIDAVYQEPLLVSDALTAEADTTAIEGSHTASTTPADGSDDVVSQQGTAQTQETGPLTQAESDITSYPANEQNTPSPEAITETDTTTPEDTKVNGNSALSPDEAQSLAEHGNEEQKLSNTPDASVQEEPAPESTGV